MCILLVEDDYLIRRIAQQVLEDTGFDVMAAEHGRHAFDHLDSYPGRFTCLVTDYVMPGGIHGGHVIERMRPLYPTIPMILATANSGATSQKWRDRHKVELLVKPYFSEELVDLVDEMLH